MVTTMGLLGLILLASIAPTCMGDVAPDAGRPQSAGVDAPQARPQAPASDEDKRAWQDLGSAWGKRAWRDLGSAWGKRAWQDLNGGWGKRAWQDLGSAWGKRAWQDLNGGWGKRAWQDLGSAWGKRAWQDLQAGWGKRYDYPELARDSDAPFLVELPAAAEVDADARDDEYPSGDEKRAWRSLGGAWGKRAGDWANFRGLSGMNEEPGSSSNEE
ncbi:prothoracicostatic peptide isoform X2 [Bacillus rossius redtenbacheri]|uniref:prothoracicostatic peptide isoform X2 n=1 Tax=Bacillus rossius redtenbacheri TaxID=93214 RepID=UPI002FDE92A2